MCHVSNLFFNLLINPKVSELFVLNRFLRPQVGSRSTIVFTNKIFTLAAVWRRNCEQHAGFILVAFWTLRRERNF
jgi:hypothetical protein